MEKDRKEKEKELHDNLRGDLKDDKYYTSNKKFYSITRSNKGFVKNWLLERCRGKKVLDYCCGDGKAAIWAAEVGAEAFGIDISGVSVENARSEANRRGISDKVKFLVMDGEAMEFDDDYFDYIVVEGVLHHLDIVKAYHELARVLKPEGEIIVVEALGHNPFIHLYRKLTPHLRTAWEAEHILRKKDIALARNYFERIETRFFHLATIGAVPFRNLSVFDTLLGISEVVDSFLLKLPFIKWQAWMILFIISKPKKDIIGIRHELEK